MGVFSTLQTLTGNPNTDVLISVLGQTDEEKGFLLNQVAPTVYSDKRKGSFPILGFADKIKNDSPRMDNEDAKESLSLGLYQVNYEVKSLDERVFIPAGLKASDEASGMLLETASIQALGELINLKAEKKFVSTITDATNYPSGHKVTVGTTDKFDYSSGTSYPVKYIKAKAEIARKLFGKYPDSIMFSMSSWIAFTNNSTVLANLPDTVHQNVAPADVIPLLKGGPLQFLKNVYIHAGVEDENVKTAARSGADLMGDDVIIFCQASESGSLVMNNGRIASGMVKAGAFITVVSMVPEDFGTKIWTPDDKKGRFAEARVAVDTILVKTQDAAGNTYPFAYIIKDTNE